MKAVILSAGQGKRLLPLTEAAPKCLLPLGGGFTLLTWQLAMLAEAGIDRLVVVTGFEAGQVDRRLEQSAGPVSLRTLYNPFYAVADNLGSVWLARDEMDEDFLLLNGDTLFRSEVVGHLLDNACAPINVTVSRSDAYDADAMKVRLADDRLVEIGKTLDPERTDAESIGMILFRGDGPRMFREAVDGMMRTADASRRWYLSVIDALAETGHVGAVEVAADDWCEVDFPVDLKQAQRTVERWRRDSASPAAMTS